MRLNTLEASVVGGDASTVTFAFKCNGLLESNEEALVGWGLWMEIVGHGDFRDEVTKKKYPMNTKIAQYVGEPLVPTGKKKGQSWEPVFKAKYQRNKFAIPDPWANIVHVENERYVFTAHLMPITDVTPTDDVTFVLNKNL